MVDQLEIETTFEVGADFRLPRPADLAPGGVEEREHRLTATYFDTGDLRLAARGITLRRRLGGPDAGWHLKIPWGRDGKREFHAPQGSHAARIPARLVRLAASATRGAPPAPVARITTERTELALLPEEGGPPLALIADDRVHGEVLDEDGGREIRWREVEAELGSGDRALLDTIGRRLLEAGARPSRIGSKLLTLLGDRVPAPPERPSGDTADAAVRGYLFDQVERVLELDPRVRLGEEDAVHQMRVATRRIRTVLRGFPTVVDRKAVRGTAAALRELAASLGTARDLEVLRERFAARLAELPSRAGGVALTADWLDAFDRRLEEARRKAVRALDGQEYLDLLDELDRLRSTPLAGRRARGPAGDVLDAELGDAVERMRTAHGRALAAEEGPPRGEAWHEVRKAAKRVRYTATAAEPVLGKRATRLRRWSAALQEVLGDHQDGVAALRFITVSGARLAGAAPDRASASATLAALAGAETAAAPYLLAEAQRIWEAGP
ncbi:CYTH and CHAD domain-containing protein [Nocardiopsis sp. RSe5-2]|uniref:CYTH and CHAD domain-containing protein n=1 Tax=Nocardiopsis endophytica TaxID=3018445 RepID=A0ABT4TX41_9ACTN|nr:CYTH and CHAD domain-containing protein [Nocardiopsis endophytica]MDA2809263.1 CYTH and CHAD domain-containing protein [Nocardiopsis endophytica]